MVLPRDELGRVLAVEVHLEPLVLVPVVICRPRRARLPDHVSLRRVLGVRHVRRVEEGARGSGGEDHLHQALVVPTVARRGDLNAEPSRLLRQLGVHARRDAHPGRDAWSDGEVQARRVREEAAVHAEVHHSLCRGRPDISRDEHSAAGEVVVVESGRVALVRLRPTEVDGVRSGAGVEGIIAEDERRVVQVVRDSSPARASLVHLDVHRVVGHEAPGQALEAHA
mmetsp:Transcript_18228/g.61921  ORF Transcript_18228/g.61921 Transcript_18228/m.61921 type:complete len:225 (+) Transcript_18228:4184-4858(+)